MKRDVALRLDGMMIAMRSALNGTAAYAQRHLTKDEFRVFVHQIGAAMGKTIDISNALYREHPDITPEELIPGTRAARAVNRPARRAPKRRAKRKGT
jgi:hypothetical protein